MNQELASGPDRLAWLLQSKSAILLDRWVQRVLDDPDVPNANRLSRPQLEDHFPKLIARLVARLSKGVPQEPEQEGRELGSSRDVGIAHARDRFAVQYSVGEALRELSHFRSALLELCDEDIGALPSEDAMLVHATIDELMAVSASELGRAEVRAFEQVMAVVAHDLRGPVQVVVGHAEFLKEGSPLPGEQCAAVGEALDRSAKRMTRLLSDLLLSSELELGHILVRACRTDLQSLVGRVMEQLRYTADRRSINMSAVLPDQDVIATCDPDRIEQALGNLVANAIKFSPVSGQVRVDLKASLKQAMFRVFDSGPGIAPEHQTDVFRPFWRGSTASSVGMGLGLSIARGIVEAHGGTIFVENAPGAGAVFCFTLPLEGMEEGANDSIDISKSLR